MTLKQALISGCAVALLSVEAQAQTPPAPPASPAPANTRRITGKVLDALTNDGQPFTRVIIKGTTTGTETELDGTFSLEVPKGPVTLLFSSQDHKDREVTVGATRDTVTVSLEASFVEEMVVVGRASEVARKNLANSVASVNAEELNRAPASTVDQALQGKVAGANIQSNSGAPGGGIQLKLRGVSTINGSTAPLYVIDGVIVSDVAIASGVYQVTESVRGPNPNATQDNQVNRIADLNPNDIESIEILKGASAAAIYGSKASNGVVIINTKRGRAGAAPKVDVTQRLGMYTLMNKLGARRVGSLDEAIAAFGPKAADYYVPGRYYDHEQQLAGRKDLSYETLASVSGAAGDTRYFVSAQVKDDKGIIANTGYQKQSFRLNLGQKLGPDIEVNASTNLVHTSSNRGVTNNDNANVSYYMVLPGTPSFVDLRSGANGLYPANPFLANGSNPLQTAALVGNDENVWRLLGAADAVWNAYKTESQSFRVLANVGVDRFQQQNTLLFPPELNFQQVLERPGVSLFGTSQVLNLNTGFNLVHNYKPVGGALSANTSAGFQYEQRGIDTVYINSQGLTAGQPNVSSGTKVGVLENRQLVKDRGVYIQEEMLLLNERLTLVGAVRGEQSSNNGNPNAIFFYPKLATAYRFASFHPAINEFKVRAAYGETGNQPLYGYKFIGLSPNSNIEGQGGLVTTGIVGNASIRPERQREFEVGLDTVLFNGDAVVEVSLYQRNISDLLLQRALAPSTGYTLEYFNGGGMRNRGVEAMLQVTPVRTPDWEWTSTATFALNRSLITDLPVPDFIVGGFGTSLGAFRIEKGASATQIVGNSGLKADGTCCEVKKIGDTEPTFRVGFSNSIKRGPISLSFLIDWQQGSDIINLTRYLYDASSNSPDYVGAGEQRQLNQKTNATTYLESATFVKLRELTLTYNLPETFVTRIPGVKTARLSLSGRNLLTLTNYSGLDPEVSNFGNQAIARNIDVAPFPPSRSFWTSIDVGF
ncbi:SusC/RagA family TonB-linked outer membrane protein [Melittangium boletus]|uniref:SusC/RagA family TonB-linked outer membrane protein n=1 Tax=Melittangium boletus DSM 14713 TaxID=1294270 RepID=A0A250IC92_9BACT|nr:SusC/RagA family TonB-linked outer membrane protein [Melittangium boletus]ATB28757.1 SusC/RagA family TonB-linked outer membrane protein [Melittangium boletus DSM 14713]